MLAQINWASDLAAVSAEFAELICASDDVGDLSFRALAGRAGGLGQRLLAEGLEPGEPVATCLRNGLAAVWASAGVRLAGAAETPLNPAFRAAERRHCLTLAGVRRVVTSRAEAPFFHDLGLDVILVEEVAPGALAGLPPVPSATWGRISFTSGTTGRPKAIVHTHGARWIANLLQRASFAFMPGPGSRVLLMTPFTHGAGLLAAAFIDHGAGVVLLDGVDLPTVERLLSGGTIDHVFAPPTVLAKLAAGFPGRHFPGIRVVFCGTAPLTKNLYAKARAIFGPVVRITYGKSEVVNPIAVLPPAACDSYYDEAEPGPGFCVGWPGTGVEIAISGDSGEALGTDAIGEVHLRAQHMLAGLIDGDGFHPMPEGSWHETGDLGRIDARGRLHLIGRTADVIKSGGYKIHPEEIETALAGSAGSGAVAVTTLPSEYWGEVIIAVAEAAPADWPARAAASAESLAKFKRPRAYVVLETLPRNAQGKVPRGEVRAMLAARFDLVDGPHPVLRPRALPGK
jgi:acyl-CoA synthetase (AMP-forming)/AMP-acid ligase II